MNENEIGKIIVDCAVRLHKELSPGLLETVNPAHKKQVLTHLELTGCKLGYLLNFGESLMKDGITRLLNGEIQ
jgi:hypothetical protein